MCNFASKQKMNDWGGHENKYFNVIFNIREGVLLFKYVYIPI